LHIKTTTKTFGENISKFGVAHT